MAQLIKLRDYPSRYESDIHHYPGRYIYLKRMQWKRLKATLENGNVDSLNNLNRHELDLEENRGKLQRIIHYFLSKLRREESEYGMYELDSSIIEEHEISQHFQHMDSISSIEELKKVFLTQIFEFQLKWGTASIYITDDERSMYSRDETLRYFLQQFPDNALVLYRPIIYLGRAPVELEIIILTPLATWCITALDEQENAVYVGSKENFWDVKGIPVERRILNPMLSVNRMEKMIKRVYRNAEVDMPIRKVILSRAGYIDYAQGPLDIEFIDKRTIEKWTKEHVRTKSLIKHTQIKAAYLLLRLCQLQEQDNVDVDED